MFEQEFDPSLQVLSQEADTIDYDLLNFLLDQPPVPQPLPTSFIDEQLDSLFTSSLIQAVAPIDASILGPGSPYLQVPTFPSSPSSLPSPAPTIDILQYTPLLPTLTSPRQPTRVAQARGSSSRSTSTPSPSPFPSQRPQARCPHCKKIFTGKKYRSELVNHCMNVCYFGILVVSPYTPMEFIQCPITNCTRKIKAHNWKSNMSDHLQTHDTDRTLVYHCTYEGCGKSYMRENSVKDCVRKHQGDKFQCETCKKGFGDRNEREKHRLVAKKFPDECVPVVENDI